MMTMKKNKNKITMTMELDPIQRNKPLKTLIKNLR